MRYWGRKPQTLVSELVADSTDLVIDPFGGSGAIVRTAADTGRRAVYLDINPYAWLVTFLNTQPINRDEFMDRGKLVLEMANEMKVRKRHLKNDFLYYRDGTPFFKKRNVDRVSQLFTLDNFRKLYALLKAIDEADASINTRIALYAAFCASLFPSSTMKRRGAGTWGVPSYWVPKEHENLDPFQIFENTLRRFSRGFGGNGDVKLLLGNALTYSYPREATLITDPPFFDEVQYMELSFFYWAWLRESAFQRYLGKRVYYRFSSEFVYNPRRGRLDLYFSRFEKFLVRTKRMKRKFLIFHEDDKRLRDEILSMVRAKWGELKVDTVTIDNQRQIGPRGGTEYLVIRS
ncbi:hypothetical protein L3N51_02365 [Metallosphaera sp. J1]|uniref:DNA methyltransferase n=1 Tax=Metallosphaera javensis (ex Hofmann et al. 2022) TaxID=99938 RepID=UPI001EDF4095|nr:DNA methyltransferase [Metallosphaera javensis (ex Hofmann et al. 2022)]MCG3110068.1 hypothetical protein [Metallosphaera javensis (ex Hofmann et al. 2022)]